MRAQGGAIKVIGALLLLGLGLVITKPSPRERLVSLAREDIGKDLREASWKEVNPALSKKSWCGAWYLSKLRQAGLTTATWDDGKGFVGKLHLPQTRNPQPGDLAYKDQPNQHYAMVVSMSPFITLDGNGAGGVVSEGTHSSTSGWVFYSIEALL